MRNKFKGAVDGLQVVDLREATPKNVKEALKFAALKFFAAQYPESAAYEDLSDQLGDKGFAYALLDSKGKVRGLSAGVVYPKANTASLTYFIIAPEESERKAMVRTLTDATRKGLNDRTKPVDAVFIEVYREGHEVNGTRDKLERNTFKEMGAIRVPLKEGRYRQPVATPEDDVIGGLHPHVVFVKQGLNDQQKSALSKAHFEAFARLYDPRLKQDMNKEVLAEFRADLDGAKWPSAPEKAPEPKGL